MKKIIKIVVSFVVIFILATYIYQFLNTCTSCNKFFVGTGYQQNAIVEAFSSQSGVLCEDCAIKHHAVSLGLGASLDDFKIKTELNPFVVIQNWFNSDNN